jgi:hypothetical protein
MEEPSPLPANAQYGHDVMEQIKITVTMDGDLAATVSNALVDAYHTGRMKDIIFCGHTSAKVHTLINLIESKLDIENRVED